MNNTIDFATINEDVFVKNIVVKEELNVKEYDTDIVNKDAMIKF